MNECTDVWTDRLTAGWTDGLMGGWRAGLLNGWTKGCLQQKKCYSIQCDNREWN